MAATAGALSYFLPAAYTAWQITGQTVADLPSPSPSALLFSPSPSSSPSASQVGAFTVLLLGSDDDSKFQGDHVLTQSMILVRIVPSTKSVTMMSIPRDLWAPLATGGSQQVLLAIKEKSKQLNPEDIPALAAALNGEVKTSISINRIPTLIALAAGFNNLDAIHQIVLASPYTHGGAPDGSLWPNWGAILP